MGRYYWDKKDTVEDCRSIGIPFLTKQGFFCGHKYGRITWSRGEREVASIGVTVSIMDDEGYVKFNYSTTHRSTEEKTSHDYKVSLAKTPCHFGGERHWFVCQCRRRIGTLYMPPGGGRFRCRHCCGISYNTHLPHDWTR
jgi:hypothetical protein